MNMKLLAVIAGLLFSGSALAFQCPADMQKIDAALAENPELSEEQLAEVQRLRNEGEELHQAGQHQASVDALAQAKGILGLQE
jgi:hypothetical protein